MPDEQFDPFNTGSPETGSQESESQQDDEEHATLPEADEQETYGLGKSIELPELRPPPRPVIERLELEQDETSAETSWKPVVRRERIAEDDPLVGDSLSSALWYPLSGQGIKVLGLYTALFWLIPAIPSGFALLALFKMILSLIAGSYAGLLLLETAAFTLERIPAGPRMPELGLESLQSGMFALAVVVIAQLPLFIMGMMFSGSDLSPLATVFLRIGGVVFVMYYVPMGLIAIVQIEDVSALNPLFVFRGIRKMWGMYFILVTTAVLPFVIANFTLNALEVHWALVALISSFLLVYSLIALMRAVSIVFRDRGIDLAQTK